MEFGEETVVLSMETATRGSGRGRRGGGGARDRGEGGGGGRLEEMLSHVLNHEFKVEKRENQFVVLAKPNDISYIFGKGSKKFRKIERKYGPIKVEEI